MHPLVHCSITDSSQDVEATLAFISVLMVEENVAYMYNVIYYSAIKKKWNLAICDMDGPWGHYANKSEKDKYYRISLTCGI